MPDSVRELPFSLVNGVPGQQLSVFDRGLNYGDGLFETLRIVESRPVLPHLHWRRLATGLQRLQIPLTSDRVEAQLVQLLQLALDSGHRNGIAKILVSRGEGGRGFAAPREAAPNVVCSWHQLPEYAATWYQDGVELQLCEQRLPSRPELAGLKHLNCLEYVLARSELSASKAWDGLLLDQRGCLIETTSANLFLVTAGRLFTPALGRCGVAGTMRHWIIETLAAKLKLDVEQADLPLRALHDADEAFVCNSVFGVFPVRRLAQQNWPRGAITAALQQQVAKLYHA